MLVTISPSKTLDFESETQGEYTTPQFLEQSIELINQLKKLSKEDISSLMKLSHKLTELNYDRYHNFSTPFNKDNARQCILAFKGDVYDGLDADSMSGKDIDYAQDHLRILSGLYGFLRPLDLIQPYRLEMGTRLKNEHGKDLYQFWGNQITDAFNEQLAKSGNVLVNLASNEYWKVLQPKNIKGRIITPSFMEYKNGQFKMIALFAKKARGIMTRYIIQNRIENPDDLQNFNFGDYSYNPQLSVEDKPVFTR